MYLNFPGDGHFPGQIGEKPGKMGSNFYKPEKIQIFGITEKL